MVAAPLVTFRLFIIIGFSLSCGATLMINTADLHDTTTYLYDLDHDPLESTNLQNNPNYASILQDLEEIANEWAMKLGVPDYNYDGEAILNAMQAAGGYAPWVNDNSKRMVTQKYFPDGVTKQPHVILFVADDLGHNEGYDSTYQSFAAPHMKEMLSQGVKLTNYYAHEYCMPSRAALLTGRYGLRYAMHALGHIVSIDTTKNELPTSAVTIGEEFQSAGYRTAAIGKWHTGYSSLSKYPTYRGFDYFYGFLDGRYDYLDKTTGFPISGTTYYFLDLFENEQLVTDPNVLDSSVYGPIDIQSKAEAAILNHAGNHASRPLFLYYATPLTHDPFDEMPAEYREYCIVSPLPTNADHRNIINEAEEDVDVGYMPEKCAMVAMMDEMLRNLTCVLQSAGMWNDTIFVFTSDNGAQSSIPGGNYPYKGHKFDPWRGSQTVPAFMSGGALPDALRGTTYNGMVHITDWLPTLMDIATRGKWTGSYSNTDGTERDGTSLAYVELDGVNIWPALLANTSSPRTQIIHYVDDSGNVGVQSGQFRYLKITKESEYTDNSIPLIPGARGEYQCSSADFNYTSFTAKHDDIENEDDVGGTNNNEDDGSVPSTNSSGSGSGERSRRAASNNGSGSAVGSTAVLALAIIVSAGITLAVAFKTCVHESSDTDGKGNSMRQQTPSTHALVGTEEADEEGGGEKEEEEEKETCEEGGGVVVTTEAKSAAKKRDGPPGVAASVAAAAVIVSSMSVLSPTYSPINATERRKELRRATSHSIATDIHIDTHRECGDTGMQLKHIANTV